MLVAGGMLLGVALLTLAIAGDEPGWFRVLAGVAGIGGLATPAFFPFFLLLLFGLVVGFWLLVSGGRATATIEPAAV
jgi:hypothetical protein